MVDWSAALRSLPTLRHYLLLGDVWEAGVPSQSYLPAYASEDGTRWTRDTSSSASIEAEIVSRSDTPEACFHSRAHWYHRED